MHFVRLVRCPIFCLCVLCLPQAQGEVEAAKPKTIQKAAHASFSMRDVHCFTFITKEQNFWLIAAGRNEERKNEIRAWKLGERGLPLSFPGPTGSSYTSIFATGKPGGFLTATWAFGGTEGKAVTEKKLVCLDSWDVTAKERSKRMQILGGQLFDVSESCKFVAVSGAYGHNPNFPAIPNPTTPAFDMTNVLIYMVPSGKILMTLKGHETGVNSAKFSSDGDTVATTDNHIHLWSLKKKEKLGVLKSTAHVRSVRALAFAPDGKSLFSAAHGGEKPVKQWDVATLKVIREFDVSGADHLAVSPDGKILAITFEEFVGLFDVSTGKEIEVWDSQQRSISRVCFSPDGKLLATAGSKGIIRVWKLP